MEAANERPVSLNYYRLRTEVPTAIRAEHSHDASDVFGVAGAPKAIVCK